MEYIRRENDDILKKIKDYRNNNFSIEETAEELGMTVDDILQILGDTDD